MGNKLAIEQAIKTFAEALGNRPKWVIVLAYKGRLIGRYGEYLDTIEQSIREEVQAEFGTRIPDSSRFTPIDDEQARKITYEYALATRKFNEQLKAERDTFAIALDGNYIIWFTFRYIVGIHLSNTGIISLDHMLDTIYHKVVVLHDAIWEIDGYHNEDNL